MEGARTKNYGLASYGSQAIVMLSTRKRLRARDNHNFIDRSQTERFLSQKHWLVWPPCILTGAITVGAPSVVRGGLGLGLICLQILTDPPLVNCGLG